MVLIGATLPFFFFTRTLVGPLSVTPPGLALMLTWLAVLVTPTPARPALANAAPYDVPLALFLAAALLSLLVTQYPLLSVRELRALILEPVALLLAAAVPARQRAPSAGRLPGRRRRVTAVGGRRAGPARDRRHEAEGVLRVQAWYPSANHLALMLGRAWPFLLAGALAWRRWLWLPTASWAWGCC